MYFTTYHTRFKSGCSLILMIMDRMPGRKNRWTGNFNRFISRIKECFLNNGISFDGYISPMVPVGTRT